MITGIHAIMFTPDAEALRAFLRDVLELPSVDAGGGELGLYEPRHPSP
jgi:catechol 2,3-dioxygenase-like lactoylglutathione lyase family enzyme